MNKKDRELYDIREGDIIKKTDSYTETCYFMRNQHLNGLGRLFGGTLMSWIDEIAGVVGRRHSNHMLITACIDNLNFKEGARLKDLVVLTGRITYVGSTSMEVRVDTYVESLQGVRKTINTAYVVLVAIDENDKPCRVPRFIPQDIRAKVEWENGKRRYELRKHRQKEGY